MDVIVVATIVRSFAGLLMADSMSPRKKQVAVITMSVLLYIGYAATHSSPSVTALFDAMLDGLTAGVAAVGIFHATQSTKNKEQEVLG